MDSIEKLKKGFKKFKSNYYGENTEKSKDYAKLIADGQRPKILMIACSDSRVSPEIIFDASPGDIFMVRNVANLVPPCDSDGHRHGTSAAIEFAVNYLGVEHIVVKGHANCGGIIALMKEESTGEFISPWVTILKKAKEDVLGNDEYSTDDEKRIACEKAAILVSLENLLTFPFIRKKYVGGKLKLHGWYFNMKDGELLGYNSESKQFESISR